MNRHSSPLSSCLNSLNGSNSKSSSSKHIKPRNNHHYNISYQNYHFNKFDYQQQTSLLQNSPSSSPNDKNYDYHLKFLLVGDSDVGKDEILNGLDNENTESQSFIGDYSPVISKSTFILLDGKKIKIQLWVADGQGRFSTIIRSYSRGAQGILLVYDITNKWSFSSLSNWLEEVEEHAPGIPKILVGNRLHLAFKRQINAYTAEKFASQNKIHSYFEISPLCNYNIKESFAELSRIVLQRHGMENLWKQNSVLSLQEICCRAIVSNNAFYSIDNLPIPNSLKNCLKSYSSSSYQPNKKYIYSYKCRSRNCINHLSFKKKAKSLFNSMFKLNT